MPERGSERVALTPVLGWLSGGVLLSHPVSGAVPSALEGLASGFGMGPGVSPSLWPPERLLSCTEHHTTRPAGPLRGVVVGVVVGVLFRFSGTAQWTLQQIHGYQHPVGVVVCVKSSAY